MTLVEICGNLVVVSPCLSFSGLRLSGLSEPSIWMIIGYLTVVVIIVVLFGRHRTTLQGFDGRSMVLFNIIGIIGMESIFNAYNTMISGVYVLFSLYIARRTHDETALSELINHRKDITEQKIRNEVSLWRDLSIIYCVASTMNFVSFVFAI